MSDAVTSHDEQSSGMNIEPNKGKARETSPHDASTKEKTGDSSSSNKAEDTAEEKKDEGGLEHFFAGNIA